MLVLGGNGPNMMHIYYIFKVSIILNIYVSFLKRFRKIYIPEELRIFIDHTVT